MSSSSSAISSSTVNGTTRYTGLSSGLDVDSIVSQLLSAEKEKKLNPLEKKEQTEEWKQDSYRTVISDIQAFADKYFNTTSSSSLLSAKNLQQYSVSSSSSAVTVSAGSGATTGSHTVAVSQLATNATLASTASISSEVTGSSAPDYSSLSGDSLGITLDGTSYTVSLSAVTDVSSLQTAVDTAVGSGKLTIATNASGCLTMTAAANSGVGSIAIAAPNSGASGLSSLGFASSATVSNRLTASTATLEDIPGLTFDSSDKAALSINSISFSFDKGTTISEMISDINNSSCGATMSYDTNTGKLVLTAGASGAGNTLAVTETSSGTNFVSTLLGTATAGTDAKVTIDNQLLTRSANTFSYNGVSYTLNATTAAGEDANISLTTNTDGIYSLINNFVTDYNSLIDTITTQLNQKPDSSYPPLTDDQKENYTEAQLETYDTNAQQGLLYHDSTLEGYLTELRSAVCNSISGVSGSVFNIGIDTSDAYTDYGKLTIDETTLKSAIQSNPDEVVNLFSKSSSSYGGTASVRTYTASQLQTRYSEEGIACRFYDITAKYTSTVKDSAGNRGILIQMAGASSGTSTTDNTLTTQITKDETAISDEKERLSDYTDKLYDKYSTLETYINNMNAQLSALSSSSS